MSKGQSGSNAPSFIAQIVGNQNNNQQTNFDTNGFLNVVNSTASQVGESMRSMSAQVGESLRQKSQITAGVGESISKGLQAGLQLGAQQKAAQLENCRKNKELDAQAEKDKTEQNVTMSYALYTQLREKVAKNPLDPEARAELDNFNKSQYGALAMLHKDHPNPSTNKRYDDLENDGYKAAIQPLTDIATAMIQSDIASLGKPQADGVYVSNILRGYNTTKNTLGADVDVPLLGAGEAQASLMQRVAGLDPKAKSIFASQIAEITKNKIEDYNNLNTIENRNKTTAQGQAQLNLNQIKTENQINRDNFNQWAETKRLEIQNLLAANTIDTDQAKLILQQVDLEHRIANNTKPDPVKDLKDNREALEKNPNISKSLYGRIVKTTGIDIFNLSPSDMTKYFDKAKIPETTRGKILTDPVYIDVKNKMIQGLALGKTPQEVYNEVAIELNPRAKTQGIPTPNKNDIGSDDPNKNILGLMAFEVERLKLALQSNVQGKRYTEVFALLRRYGSNTQAIQEAITGLY